MKRISAVVIAATVVVTSACGEAPTNDERLGTAASDLTTITRSQALSRGQLWVAAKLPYCQSANHQPDGDKACAKVCTRPSNAQWDPYRSDCSGFVSWSWGLSAPGRTTAELAPAVTDITHTIDPKSLMPGDAVNKPSDHTMLFVKWITPGVRATFMEEPGCSSSTPYAHQIDTDVKISGMSITIVENGITFSAIRFNAIAEDPDAGAPAPDAAGGTSGGGEDAGSTPKEEDAGGSGGFTAPHEQPTSTDSAVAPPSSGGCSASGIRSDAGGPLGGLLLALGVVVVRRRSRRAA